MFGLSKNQIRALKALPVIDKDRPNGVEDYTIGSLNRLVELGFATEEQTKKGLKWDLTPVGKAARRELDKEAA